MKAFTAIATNARDKMISNNLENYSQMSSFKGLKDCESALEVYEPPRYTINGITYIE